MAQRAATLLGLLAVTVAGARAARAEDPPSSFVLTFESPGARSMAFGGAFTPLADDATAAYANPAGLVQLLRPEVSAELRVRGALENDSSGKAAVTSANGLSYFSVVYPLHRFSFAVYGHTLARVDVKAVNSSGSQAGEPGAGRVAAAVAGERLSGLDIWRVGAAGAFRLRDNLSLGLGVSYFHGTVELAPSGDPAAARRSVTSTDWGLNAGALWSPAEDVRLGAFYREGPKLSLAAQEAAPCTAPECTSRPLRLPDTFGAGAALRSLHGALTVAFEWDRVRYSSLVAGLSDAARGTDQLSLADANEFHFGAEYAFLRVDPVLAARLGAWLDPDHRLCGAAADSPYQCASGSHSDEIHVTTGFGVAFRRFQIDVGVDISRSQVSSSISGLVSF